MEGFDLIARIERTNSEHIAAKTCFVCQEFIADRAYLIWLRKEPVKNQEGLIRIHCSCMEGADRVGPPYGRTCLICGKDSYPCKGCGKY